MQVQILHRLAEIELAGKPETVNRPATILPPINGVAVGRGMSSLP